MAILMCGLMVLAGRADPASTNALLLPNGGFETPNATADWPAGWPHGGGTTWEKEGENHFLRIHSDTPDKMFLVYLDVPMRPEYKALELSYRVRYSDIKVGKNLWFDGRIMMNFKDAKGKTLNPSPAPPIFRGSKAEWETHSQKFLVPAGATKLEIMPALFQAASGTLDFDDFRLTPIDAAQIPPPPPPPPPPPVIASATLSPTSTTGFPPALHVVGNRLETAQGKVVWLQGLSVDSLQWAAGGEHIDQTIPVAIDQWHANAIRLAMDDNFWFGRGGHNQPQHDGGLKYRAIIDNAVQLAASRGAYLILDLHAFGAPKDAHIAFWKDAALRYKDHPAVLFELFNEPHSLTWKVWRDGGNLHEKENAHADVNPTENNETSNEEKTPGMQALLDAARSTGAKNMVLVGGLDWAYDLSGVAKGFGLQERGGNGIMYVSHIYPWKSDWQGKVLVAADKYPLIITEVGCPPDYKGFQFIPPSGRHPLEGWSEDVIGLIQKYRLNWTAFSFHPHCGPMVISDFNYTPTPYWGVYVKDALAGKTFDMKKMR